MGAGRSARAAREPMSDLKRKHIGRLTDSSCLDNLSSNYRHKIRQGGSVPKTGGFGTQTSLAVPKTSVIGTRFSQRSKNRPVFGTYFRPAVLSDSN
jgi:hypothetical protein